MASDRIEEAAIRELFRRSPGRLRAVRQAAVEAARLIEDISIVMERFTGAVCPDCTSVCCIQRHARFDRSDIIFMAALGSQVPEYLPGPDDTLPCRFLGGRGCTRRRSERPWRCTWFFCAPLLDHLIAVLGPAAYRRFMQDIRAITDQRLHMLDAFDLALASGASCRPDAACE